MSSCSSSSSWHVRTRNDYRLLRILQQQPVDNCMLSPNLLCALRCTATVVFDRSTEHRGSVSPLSKCVKVTHEIRPKALARRQQAKKALCKPVIRFRSLHDMTCSHVH